MTNQRDANSTLTTLSDGDLPQWDWSFYLALELLHRESFEENALHLATSIEEALRTIAPEEYLRCWALSPALRDYGSLEQVFESLESQEISPVLEALWNDLPGGRTGVSLSLSHALAAIGSAKDRSKPIEERLNDASRSFAHSIVVLGDFDPPLWMEFLQHFAQRLLSLLHRGRND